MNDESREEIPLKKAVKSYYADKKLSAEQLEKLSSLSDNPVSDIKPLRVHKFGMFPFPAIAASILIFIAFFSYNKNPDIITAAYSDIIHDEKLSNGLSDVHKNWIAVNEIKAAPSDYNVEMSKFCDIDGFKTMHLRIAGKYHGKMNLFFKKGSRSYRFGKSSGITKDMKWKVLESNKDITVIVMYTKDMRENVVNNIIGTMLPDLIA